MSEATNVPEFPVDGPSVTTPRMSRTRPFYWSVRRELWENRSLYIAPFVVTALVLFGSLVNILRLRLRLQHLSSMSDARLEALLLRPFQMAPAPIMLTTFVVALFYCLDALYGERRDRSILFWKSLPVSDRTTVLAKVAVPLAVLPLIALALSVATQLIMLMVGTLVLAGTEVGPMRLWSAFSFFEGPLVMLYGLTVHVLWFAPIYGWLLLISAWAKRAAILWAVLPFLALATIEWIVFQSHYFMLLLRYRVTGAMREAFSVEHGRGGGSVDRLWQLAPGNFLSTPGLWAGLAFAGVCIAAAVRLRRNREPI